jgi:chromosome partitioning protein
MPSRIIGIVNEKGGCGKTTTAVNLAALLALAGTKRGNSVLLIDMDPQGSAAKCVGKVANFPEKGSLAEVLRASPPGRIPLDEYIHRSEWDGHLDFIPTHHDSMASAHRLMLENNLNPAQILDRVLKPIADRYQYIIIDSGPSVGILFWNVLLACNFAIVPTIPDYINIEGLPRTFEAMERIKNEFGRKPELIGILPTVYRTGIDAHERSMMALRNHFGDMMLPSIPQNVDVQEAFGRRVPVYFYNPRAPAAEAYGKVTMEVIKRVKEKAPA